MPSSSAQIIDFTAARAESARQKRRAELAAARRAGALLPAQPVFAFYGTLFGYPGYSQATAFGLPAPIRMATSPRYWGSR